MSLFVDQANELKAALADTSKPTLIEFYATWCPHCQHMAPIVDDVRRKVGDKAHIVTIDTEAHPELAKEFNVQGFPTWFIYKDGRQFCTNSGEQSEETILDALNAAER